MVWGPRYGVWEERGSGWSGLFWPVIVEVTGFSSAPAIFSGRNG